MVDVTLVLTPFLARLGGLRGNNKCRNPDAEEAPWCLTGRGEYELCDIPTCSRSPVSAIQEQLGNKKGCGSDKFQCR